MLSCFKSYDVRGRIGRDLDTGVANRIGRAVAEVLQPGTVVVGRDPRASSEELQQALVGGLSAGGARVLSLGLCGTEEVYFSTGLRAAGAGIMVTASHNPIDYNGMKLVGPGSRPLSDDEFAAIRQRASSLGPLEDASADAEPIDDRSRYAEHVCGFVDVSRLAPLRILADAGNGAAGPTFDAIVRELERRGSPMTFVRQHHEPDGSFPNGIPNPLLRENRGVTSAAVRENGADLGAAWDGDFDRCFFFDEAGEFVDGEYVVALLAESVLAQQPGATIVHDPRVVWATTDAVARSGGRAVAARTGHAHLKAAMREAGAAYGGEMSAHHYFRDFYNCDSGMIPLLLVAARVSETGLSLGELVAERKARFPSSGEVNFEVANPKAAIERVVAALGGRAEEVDRLDGASLVFPEWRMNLRASNTEPLLRLNMESRGDRDLLATKLVEVTRLIEGQPG